MWEFTISISYKYRQYLKYILTEINYTKINIISVIKDDNTITHLTIAVDINSMQRIANVIVECICNIILFVFKKEYFNNKLDFKKMNITEKSVFLKALVMFDSLTDKEEIKQEIILNKTLNIDSFYYFKLAFMREKWEEVFNIINCSPYMADSDSFLDLIKFLVNNLDCNIPLINVYYKNNKYLVFDNKNKLIKLKDKGSDTEIDLINQIIELSPKTINLYCSRDISKNTFDIIYYLFDKKINIIN